MGKRRTKAEIAEDAAIDAIIRKRNAQRCMAMMSGELEYTEDDLIEMRRTAHMTHKELVVYQREEYERAMRESKVA